MKINRPELIEKIAKKGNLTKKDSDKFLDAFIDVVGEELANNNEIFIMGFGIFEVRERSERKGVNPQTGKEIMISAHKIPSFKAGIGLKKIVSGGKSSDDVK